jgi:hypothetical protein
VRVKRHFIEDVSVDELSLVTQLLALNLMFEAACSDRPVARDIARAAVELLARYSASQLPGDPGVFGELSSGLKTAKENYSVGAAHFAEAQGPWSEGSTERRKPQSRPWFSKKEGEETKRESNAELAPETKRRVG